MKKVENPTKQQILLAKRLKEKRNQFKYSLKDAGKKIGINYVVLYAYENLFQARIDLDVIERMAKVYNTTPEYLCGWGKEPIDVRKENKLKNTLRAFAGGLLSTVASLSIGMVVALFGGSSTGVGLSMLGSLSLFVFMMGDFDPADRQKFKRSLKGKKNSEILKGQEKNIEKIDLDETQKLNIAYNEFKSHVYYELEMPKKNRDLRDAFVEQFLKMFFYFANLRKDEKKFNEYVKFDKKIDFNKMENEIIDDISIEDEEKSE